STNIILVESKSRTTYIEVYNELKGAYNELWNEKAQQSYGQYYEELAKEYQIAIRNQIPLVISEAEPSDHSTKSL
ncbi:MAG: biopolymer transporter ExbD, partial [Bacteroidota bacterium]